MNVKMKSLYLFILTLFITPTAFAANYSQETVCRAAIGSLMGHDPKIIKTNKTQAGITFLSYFRPSDKSKWSLRCKLENNKVIWANDTGRWRTDPFDGTVNYSLSTDKKTLSIIETFYDGSKSKNDYLLTDI